MNEELKVKSQKELNLKLKNASKFSSLEMQEDPSSAPWNGTAFEKIVVDKIGSFLNEHSLCNQKGKRIFLESLEIEEASTRLLFSIKNIYENSEVFFSQEDISLRIVLFSGAQQILVQFVIFFEQKYMSIRIRVYSREILSLNKAIKKIENEFYTSFKEYKSPSVGIDWYFQSVRGLSSVFFLENIVDTFFCSAYPFINKGEIDTYINEYLRSSDRILFLIGPPGTGKTRFIRYIMKKMGERDLKRPEIHYTSDQSILNDDSFFISFLEKSSSLSKHTTLVLEDADFNLISRKSGNVFMQKLLSSSDGLIQSSNSKIIISTNLSHVNDVDEALLREGRCFDIIKFRKLNTEEGEIFLSDLTGERHFDLTEDYTLAELYRIGSNKEVNQKKSVASRSAGFNV